MLCMFQENYFSSYILLTDQILLSDSVYFLSTWQYVYYNCLIIRLWRCKFEINFVFVSSRFGTWPKRQDKNLNILRTKRAFDVKYKKHFSLFLKGRSAAKNCTRTDRAFIGALQNTIFSSRRLITCCDLKTIFPDNCNTYNMNDNPKNSVFLSENVRKKRLTILEYFDAYMCHHYEFKIIQ